MNSDKILTYMHHPELLQKAEAEDLQRALEEYPYSSILQVLYAKALKNQNNYLYPKQLKRAALAVPNRKVLHHWLEGESTKAVGAEEEKQPVLSFKAIEPKAQVAPVVLPPTPVEKPLSVEAETVLEVKKPMTVPLTFTEPVEVEPVKEDDLDLANLPASVRETVLRARKIRSQFGGETEKKPAPIAPPQPVAEEPKRPETPQHVEVPNPISELPAEPQFIEASIEEKPALHVFIPVVIAEEPPVEEPEMAEKEVNFGAQSFVLSNEEPIEEKQVSTFEKQSQPKHSFLDWLETGMLADDADDDVELDFDEDEEIEEVEETFVAEEESVDEPIVEKPAAPIPTTERAQELLQSFIDKPRLTFRAPVSDDEIDMAGLSTSSQSDYITETLAQVYVTQKLYNRAINAYEILRLKYPEKSSFFATRILEIKQFLNEKN